jgi:hypothetical protein
MDDGSSDDDGIGGILIEHCCSVRPSNGNQQQHHQRQEEGGEGILLEKNVFPYITVLTGVNENFGLRDKRGNVDVEMLRGRSPTGKSNHSNAHRQTCPP